MKKEVLHNAQIGIGANHSFEFPNKNIIEEKMLRLYLK